MERCAARPNERLVRTRRPRPGAQNPSGAGWSGVDVYAFVSDQISLDGFHRGFELAETQRSIRTVIAFEPYAWHSGTNPSDSEVAR
jgi:hypothetical protein